MQTQTLTLPWGNGQFVLRRSQRRSVGLQISPEGLVVTAPLRLPIHDIQKIVQSKQAWVQSRLDQLGQRAAQSCSLEDLLTAGQAIPVRGTAHTVQFCAGLRRPILNPWQQCIALPDKLLNKSADVRTRQVEQALREHALEVFESSAKRLALKLAPGTHLPSHRVMLSAPKARWGSCNQQGDIRINWRLIHYPPACIDYVLAHEMAHLFELNHSSRFWQRLENFMPAYQVPHRQLQQANPASVPLVLDGQPLI